MNWKLFIVVCGLFLFMQYSEILSQSKSNLLKKNYSITAVEQIKNIELTWLENLHNKIALDTILADDFIHVLPQGILITKSQHINWIANHPLPSGYTQKFDTLSVRVYGSTGIANGIVETRDQNGKSIHKSIFTDVFFKRNGKWQAVNAQENNIK